MDYFTFSSGWMKNSMNVCVCFPLCNRRHRMIFLCVCREFTPLLCNSPSFITRIKWCANGANHKNRTLCVCVCLYFIIPFAYMPFINFLFENCRFHRRLFSAHRTLCRWKSVYNSSGENEFRMGWWEIAMPSNLQLLRNWCVC